MNDYTIQVPRSLINKPFEFRILAYLHDFCNKQKFEAKPNVSARRSKSDWGKGEFMELKFLS